VLEELRWKAGSLILDVQRDAVVRRLGAESYRASAVPKRVVHEVSERLLDP